jgi:hypothetical protein
VTPADLVDLGDATRRVAAYVAGMLAVEADPDGPSHVIGIGATRDVPTDLRQQPHATAFAVRPTAGVDAPAGIAVPVTTRHAPVIELLTGRTLLATLDGVVVLGWSQLPLGGPRVRFALGVSRDGDEVQGMVPDTGGPSIEAVPAARALAPGDPLHDGAVLPGRLVAATRRYLRLPTAPPSATPWVLLCDVWATMTLEAYDRARRTGGDTERLAWDAVALRPDVALATQRRTRAHLARAGGPGPTAVDLRSAYAEPDAVLAGQLPHRAALNTHDPVAAMQAFLEESVASLTEEGALWDAGCVLFPAPEDGEPVAAPEWYDASALVRHVADATGTRPGATTTLLSRDDVPRWLRASTERLLTAAEAAGTAG